MQLEGSHGIRARSVIILPLRPSHELLQAHLVKDPFAVKSRTAAVQRCHYTIQEKSLDISSYDEPAIARLRYFVSVLRLMLSILHQATESPFFISLPGHEMRTAWTMVSKLEAGRSSALESSTRLYVNEDKQTGMNMRKMTRRVPICSCIISARRMSS